MKEHERGSLASRPFAGSDGIHDVQHFGFFLDDEPAGVERKPRSESVHNFGGHGASRLRSMALLPRSLTSNRVNPFDATGWQLGGAPASRRLPHPPPQRCETLTSDYCSQDSSVSILGIANPLYDAQVNDFDNVEGAWGLNGSGLEWIGRIGN